MTINKVYLRNFRKLKDFAIEFDPKLNIIIGNNAVGKTSVLESIFIGAFTKSFRTQTEREVVNFDSTNSYTKIDFSRKNGFNENVEYSFTNGKEKYFKKNGVKETSLAMLSNIQLVIFHPDDLNLIKGTPIYRRKYLNRELSNISKVYCENLKEYNKALNNRNTLLKRKYCDDTELAVWNDILIEKGSKILLRRIDFINKISTHAYEIHKSITSGKEHINIEYDSKIFKNIPDTEKSKFQTIDRANGKQLLEILSNSYKEILSNSITMDKQKRTTTVGPHRDDFEIFINEKSTKTYGSQGQQRTASISIKLSEVKLIEKETGEEPIILLDDIMSELDVHRQRDLIKTFEDLQVIITTTDIENLLNEYVIESKIIKIEV